MGKKFIVFFITSFSLYAQNILSLNLEDLSQIDIKNDSATLIKTYKKDTPASTTVITQKDIFQSGARNLDELLEIYVPSFAYMYKVQGTQIGMRGIINDRNNKILLLVNGKVMNIKASDSGAITERWFSMLSDIRKITIIRGPGSSIYGPGAIAGIINIETFNSQTTKEGLRVGAKVGSVEDFTTAEISYTKKLSNDLGLYIYYGLDKANGSQNDDSNEKFGFNYDFSSQYLYDIYADNKLHYETVNDGASFQNTLRHKFYSELNGENYKVWLRFTRSSQAVATAQYTILSYINAKMVQAIKDSGTQNQQLTLFSQYNQYINKNLSINYFLSYMRSDVYIKYSSAKNESRNRYWGEDNINAKILANYEFNENNKLAFGGEYDYNKFGRKSSLINEQPSLIAGLTSHPDTKWDSDMFSIFAEYQYDFLDDYILFLDTRADKHTYSDWMISPRAAVVYHYSDEDTLKLIASKSVRHSDEADMYKENLLYHQKSDVETLQSYEFIYNKSKNNFDFDLSCYYNIHDIVAFNDNNFRTQYIGTAKSYGFEAQLNYIYKEKLFLNISHSFTKLHNFKLNDPNIKRQNISASVYGYGDDFSNWNNNITKIRADYKINKNLKWVNSLRIFWGIPGAKDMSAYNNTLYASPDTIQKYKFTVLDTNNAIKQSIYLNTGITYKPNKTTDIALNAYNILGIFDEDLNKRNFFQQVSHYRNAAPSISININFKIY